MENKMLLMSILSYLLAYLSKKCIHKKSTLHGDTFCLFFFGGGGLPLFFNQNI